MSRASPRLQSIAIIALCCVLRVACLPSSVQSTTQVVATPVSVTPSSGWYGIDGQWSAFPLQIGTPPQYLEALISTAVSQAWVIGPLGCQSVQGPVGSYPSCEQSHGGFFNPNSSSSFRSLSGTPILNPEDTLWPPLNASFGLDVSGIGKINNGSFELANATVIGVHADVGVTDYWMNSFGLNAMPEPFNESNYNSTGYLAKLQAENIIPSVAYGYTAGAVYRFGGVPASLIFGGYDQGRFVPNDVTLLFSNVSGQNFLTGIKSILADTTTEKNISLLPYSVNANIDSGVTGIWLPIQACRAFEQAFDLVYNETAGLYLVNETQHEHLLQLSPNITFVMGSVQSGIHEIIITLPYQAFDLEFVSPYRQLGYSSRYFPLHRINSSFPSVLGRVFMQEAYLTANFESQTFTLSQCKWDEKPQETIVPIYSSQTNTSLPSSGGSSVNVGMIVGAVVGAVVACLLIFGIAFCLFHRRRIAAVRTERKESEASAFTNSPFAKSDKSELPATTAESQTDPNALTWVRSLDGTLVLGRPSADEDAFHEAEATAIPLEADDTARSIHEMPGDHPAASELPNTNLEMGLTDKEGNIEREKLYNGIDLTMVPDDDQAETPRTKYFGQIDTQNTAVV